MSSMEFRPRKKHGQISLNVTPLIDVLFLLIIFFTLTSTFKRVGELELQLPDSSTANAVDPDRESHLVELIALEDGGLRLDGEMLETSELKARLLESRREDPEARVMIKAESGVDHGEVVLLLDIVRDAGFPGVGIGTHRKGEL